MKKTILFQFGLGLLVCILLVGGYTIWYAQILAENSMVNKLQSKINQDTAALNRATYARSVLTDLAPEEALVHSYFVPQDNAVGFIDSLESRGKMLGTKVSVLSVDANDSNSLALSITVSGTFDAVMRTLGAIEYAPYSISVNQVSVASSGDPKALSWHADIKLVVGSTQTVLATTTPITPP